MPFLLLNPDNSIQDITELDENNTGIEVSSSDMNEVASHPLGHMLFDFVAGNIVLNTARSDAFELASEKIKAIDKVIDDESKASASGRQQALITAMENAPNLAALDALR